MKTRDLIILALFIGIGAVLHAISPPFLFGMRPDTMLSMMFLGILLFPKVSYVLVLSVATGALSALTTTMPGGQISNMVDKPITAFIFLGLFLLIRNVGKQTIRAPILAAIGTIVSGSVFLGMVAALGLLPDAFTVLFVGVVLPAALFNIIFIAVLYPILQNIMKRTQQPASI